MGSLCPQPRFWRCVRSTWSRARFAGRLLLAVAAVLLATAGLRAADSPAIIPLDQIKPGMAGRGVHDLCRRPDREIRPGSDWHAARISSGRGSPSSWCS